jgi:tetratricopeptide (TPR) repeat protein
VQVLRKALRTHAIPPEELLDFAAAMLGQSNPSAAAEASREAVRRIPRALRARAQLARALVEDGRGDEASEVLEDPAMAECFGADAADSESLTVVGMAFQSLGRVPEAREWLTRAIQAPSPIGLAFYAYVYSGKVKVEDREIVDAIEARLARAGHPDDIPPLHFALGKALEDLGEFERAMAEFDAANHCNRFTSPDETPFDRMQKGSTADQAMPVFTREFLTANASSGSQSELPIFVVGMIRSGTTLAEQVLSSHSLVGGAGEAPFWIYNTLDAIDGTTGVPRPDRLRDAADRYVALLSAAHPGKERVVDKMPANFKNLGVLHLAFPNARFIHMRRNPVDTCLSIYSTHSRAVGELGNDKSSLVAAYRHYLGVMEQWREVLPADRLLDVDYEELVTNSDATIRRMIAFCGLDWDDACVQPESNSRAVATPSLWQVRQPINTGSMGRWKRFEPWLGELAELLEC